MKPALLAAAALAAIPAALPAANIYMLSSGDPITDTAAVNALTAAGHTVTVGLQYSVFDGTTSLAGFQTVYLQANFNWTGGNMPVAGQQQLIDFVNAGGRLVTSEWVNYYAYAGARFGTLGSVLPVVQSFSYASNPSCSYTQITADPAISAGVPASFTFNLTSYTGTELLTVAKAGATTYYNTSTQTTAPDRFGLAGWAQGSGLVYSFNTTCGPDQVGDANFARLFSNVMGPTGPTGCYANCDNSATPPVANVADFTCFLQKFAATDSYANCDGSTTPPTINVADFTCFLQKFASGCP